MSSDAMMVVSGVRNSCTVLARNSWERCSRSANCSRSESSVDVSAGVVLAVIGSEAARAGSDVGDCADARSASAWSAIVLTLRAASEPATMPSAAAMTNAVPRSSWRAARLASTQPLAQISASRAEMRDERFTGSCPALLIGTVGGSP